MSTNYGTVLFDLDGTLLDTAPDLNAALSGVLRKRGLPALAVNQIKPAISTGARGMVRFALGEAVSTAECEQAAQELVDIYRTDLASRTRLFAGMERVLDELEQRRLSWGVVTNKRSDLTDPLLQALNLDTRAACVVSGDSTPYMKPHPAPLLEAAKRLRQAPERCVYIGDAQRDIEAGRRAGMTTLVAAYGYLKDADEPQNWGADGIVHQPLQILSWLDGHE